MRGRGLLSGVTTNPGLISAAGPGHGEDVARVVDASPGPVLVQVIGWHDPDPMIRQARWLHAFSDQIIVKLPSASPACKRSNSSRPSCPTCARFDLFKFLYSKTLFFIRRAERAGIMRAADGNLQDEAFCFTGRADYQTFVLHGMYGGV